MFFKGISLAVSGSGNDSFIMIATDLRETRQQ